MTSIRRQLTVGLLLGFAVLLGSGALVIYLAARSSLYSQFDASLKAQASIMTGFVKIERAKFEFEFPRSLALENGLPGRVEFYELFKANGTSLVRSPSLGKSDLPVRFSSATEPAAWDLALPDGTAGRALGLRFRPKFELAKQPAAPTGANARAKPDAMDEEESEQPDPNSKLDPGLAAALAGELALVIATSRSSLDESLRRLAVIVLVAGGWTLLATAFLVPWVLRQGLIPLRQLGNRAKSIDAASLGTRFPTIPLPAELAPISHGLNDLLARLENSFERERRFGADLAHELRTAIAGLRTTAEVALKWGHAEDRESFQAVLELAQQMEVLVDRLLTLARSEDRSLPVQRQPVALAPLLESLWQPLQPKAAARKLTATFEVPAHATIETDPALLRGILVNLLTNAADYTATGGAIQVRFTQGNGQFKLSVSNTARELAPADLSHFFQRFWRKDRARSDAGHAGLGLPLAKSFAELLGLELTAELDQEGSLALCLEGNEKRI